MLNRDTESKGRDSSEKNLAGVKNKIGTEERDKKNRRILDSSIIANQRVISKGIVSRYATVTVQRDGSYATCLVNKDEADAIEQNMSEFYPAVSASRCSGHLT
ncbi:hypothetical protein F2Q69_00043752 [Brassica cretica]|uniref:Uncharacterized protein n=1 Tax=Brassica cretica TaxID=69181 RepID=A0A8S9NWB4_BRACR|nr:hypothetical protein F2Q69_00043752 [Brassica cretica]